MIAPLLSFSFLDQLVGEFDRLYIEVPDGVPFISKPRQSKLLHLIHLMATMHPLFWGPMTAPSAGRQSTNLRPLRQSEHLSFFKPGNISEYLYRRWGESVSANESVGEIVAPDGTKVKSISVYIERVLQR